MAIQSTLSGDLPKSLFESVAENDDEADAMYNLWQARSTMQSQQGNGRAQ